MKMVILGAGSLGSAIGGLLAEAGHAVWLVTRDAAHVQAVQAHGLTLVEESNGRVVDRTVPAYPAGNLRAVKEARDITESVDLVVVLVKSQDTQAVLESARHLIGEATTLLSLQNGLGHEDVLAAVAGPARVLAGKTYVGGVLLAPGRVRVGAQGKETIIGELAGGVSERVDWIAKAFSAAGLVTQVSANIQGAMWDKIFVNVATGALSGITGLDYGGLYAQAEIAACAQAAVAEAMAVARAAGVVVSCTDPALPWEKARAGLPSQFKASMLQSLEKGRPTEVDFINGAIVAQGRKHGVPTPVNQTLVACIKGIERQKGLHA